MNILYLLKNYELVFEKINLRDEVEYVIPAKLDTKPIKWKGLLPASISIKFLKFKLDFSPFLPPGLVNKLMVRMHERIFRQCIWKNNAIFHHTESNNYAHVYEIWEDRCIYIDYYGENDRALWDEILVNLETLRKSFSEMVSIDKLSMDAFVWNGGQWDSLETLKRYNVEIFNSTNKVDKNTKDMYHYEEELNGLRDKIQRLIEKKNYLEKEKDNAYDAEKKYALKRQIKELEQEIDETRDKITNLGEKMNRTGVDSASAFDLRTSLQTLSEDVKSIKSGLDDSREENKKLLTELSGQINSISDEIRIGFGEILTKVDENAFSDAQMEAMMAELSKEMEANMDKLPASVVQQWKELTAKDPEIPEVKGKFKLKMTIIPNLLTYEKELSYDINGLVKNMWTDLRNGNIFTKK